jgi:hypothetical protein
MRRELVLFALLFIAVALASLGWYWNRAVSLRAQAGILIKTKEEAVACAKDFLVRANVDTGDFDLFHPKEIKSERFKGADVWWIRWSTKTNVASRKDLLIEVCKDGSFWTVDRSNPTNHIEIWGGLTYTNIWRQGWN